MEGVNSDHENGTQVIIESANPRNTNCSYCNESLIEELWCKKCDPFQMIKGWTSGNRDIDEFIKDTIYNARHQEFPKFLQWAPFDRFIDTKQIGEGEFAKVYSATWIDGRSTFEKQGDGSWKRLEAKPVEVTLKKLKGSQNMSVEYLNEVCFTTYVLYSYYLTLNNNERNL